MFYSTIFIATKAANSWSISGSTLTKHWQNIVLTHTPLLRIYLFVTVMYFYDFPWNKTLILSAMTGPIWELKNTFAQACKLIVADAASVLCNGKVHAAYFWFFDNQISASIFCKHSSVKHPKKNPRRQVVQAFLHLECIPVKIIKKITKTKSQCEFIEMHT